MTLINDRAHDVVDRACETLTRWPHDFIDQEDLVMLIHGAIEDAVQEERCAIAYELGGMRTEAETVAERAVYDKIAALLDARSTASSTPQAD